MTANSTVVDTIVKKILILSANSKLFKNKVECVLLNACYSQVQAQAIHQNIDYVIGMNRAVSDTDVRRCLWHRAAIKFAVRFYDAISVGRSVKCG
jgi:hypothetical protein